MRSALFRCVQRRWCTGIGAPKKSHPQDATIKKIVTPDRTSSGGGARVQRKNGTQSATTERTMDKGGDEEAETKKRALSAWARRATGRDLLAQTQAAHGHIRNAGVPILDGVSAGHGSAAHRGSFVIVIAKKKEEKKKKQRDPHPVWSSLDCWIRVKKMLPNGAGCVRVEEGGIESHGEDGWSGGHPGLMP